MCRKILPFLHLKDRGAEKISFFEIDFETGKENPYEKTPVEPGCCPVDRLAAGPCSWPDAALPVEAAPKTPPAATTSSYDQAAVEESGEMEIAAEAPTADSAAKVNYDTGGTLTDTLNQTTMPEDLDLKLIWRGQRLDGDTGI